MKKISIVIFLIISALLAGNTLVFSQSTDYAKSGSSRRADNALDESTGTKPANIAAVSPRSMATFVKLFGNPVNVLWTKADKNLDRAYFVNDGITVRAQFDKKGKLMYTIRYYSEEHLPKDILYNIKKAYYDKSIFGVVEVNVDGKTAYLVDLQDNTSWLKLKIVDGEMNEESVFLKR